MSEQQPAAGSAPRANQRGLPFKHDPYESDRSIAAPPWLRRVTLLTNLLAALVCLMFVGTLRDLSNSALWISALQAPRLPDDSTARDATLLVTVRDEHGRNVDNAMIRVFTLRADGTYLAGQANTDSSGRARIEALPHGENWIIVERAGLARASSQLALDKGERQLDMVLKPAETFEVVVIDPLQRAVSGASVAIHGSDPLPYRIRSDSHGLARVSGVGPGPYAIDVSAKGYGNKFIIRATLKDSPLFVKLERLGGLIVTVQTQQGKPVVAADVVVAGSALWPARSGSTNNKGQVTISGLPRGFYDLRAEKGDRVSRSGGGVMLERGQTKRVTIKLVQGIYVRVRVSDGEGDRAPPIENASVALVERGISSFPRYGRSDANGWVELGPIADDDATVSARADGFVARSAVALEEDQRELHIGLVRGAKLVGRVVDEEGFPVAGAQIEVVGVDLYGIPIAESSTLSGFRDDHFSFALPGAIPLIPAGELGVMPIVPDVPRDLNQPGQSRDLRVERSLRTTAPWVSGADGHFVLSPVTPGNVRLMVHHPGYIETLSDSVALKPGQRGELTVVLRRGGVLEGRVMEIDRGPVAGARIEITSLNGATQRITFAAEDGTFAFIGLPEHIVVSVARPDEPQLVAERLALDIAANDRREVEIILPKRRDPITVRVTDEAGYPIDRVQVRITSVDPDAPLRRTVFTDDNGEAVSPQTRGLPLRIELWRRGRAPVVAQFERASTLIDLAMGAGLTATGEVYNNGRAVNGATVLLLTPSGVRQGRSDKEGAFELTDLAQTSARLRVSADGLVVYEALVDIAGDPAKPTDLGRLELVAAAVIEGEVLDERGDGIAGARVAAGRVPTYLPLGELPPGVARTDRAGKFRLRGVAPGEVVLQAYKVGYGRQTGDPLVIEGGDHLRDVRLVLEQDPNVDPTQPTPASLAVTLGEHRDRGRVVIVFEHVPPGGEAERAGILAGDQLVAINNITIRSLEQARRRLNGPIGEDFVAELARAPDLHWKVRVQRERLRR